MKITAASLALLTSISHASEAPVPPADITEKLRENHIAIVEELDPFTDQTTLGLQVVGVALDGFERRVIEWLRNRRELLEAGVSPEKSLLTPPEVVQALFVMKCDPDGTLLSFPLVVESGQDVLRDGVRIRIDDDPMLGLEGTIGHNKAAALLDRLKDANKFIVQRNPPTAGHHVFTFTLQREQSAKGDAFDRRPTVHEFRKRCAARRP